MSEMKPYMTEKRKYERPTMRDIELQHRTMILAGSGEWPADINPMDDPEDI